VARDRRTGPGATQNAARPLATEADRAAATAQRDAALALSQPDGFPESLDRVPVMLVILADLTALAATDRDLDRYQIAGGASIYPFVWNILLAAHERGVGGVMTTVAIRNESGVLNALEVPPNFAVASIVALGYPAKTVTKLTRRAVGDFTTVDAFVGAPFGAD
jgi:nitroreductase